MWKEAVMMYVSWVLTTAEMSTLFWGVIMFGPVGWYQRFGGTSTWRYFQKTNIDSSANKKGLM
jgi:hypothetical protein